MVESHILFAHILTQTKQNVQLLVAQRLISEADGREILSRLSASAEKTSNSEETSVVALSRKTQQLSMSPGPPKVEARAIWGWSSEDPNDLSFEAGEIIEIVTETNVDWWSGRNRSGKQGLFPSNYVEKLAPRGVSPGILVPEPRKSMLMSKRPAEPRYPSPALPYPSPLGPPQPYYQQPPPAGYYPPPGGPPPPDAVNYSYGPPPVSVPGPEPQSAPQGAQQAPPKKNKFGGLGQMMAQSTANGIGLGAGAAIGSGIVNAIF